MTKKKLTEQEFVKKYSGVPWSLEDLADFIYEKVEYPDDESSLVHHAAGFLDAQRELTDYLEDIGYEFG